MTIEAGAGPAAGSPVADLERQRARRREAMREEARRRELEEIARLFQQRVASAICVPEGPRSVTLWTRPPANDGF